MIRPGNDIQVYLYADPVDMRKSIDGLSILVEQEMELSPNNAIDFQSKLISIPIWKYRYPRWQASKFLITHTPKNDMQSPLASTYTPPQAVFSSRFMTA